MLPHDIMNLADVFTVLFAVIATLAVMVGYWLLAAGLFPGCVKRCSETIGTRPVRTTLLGAITLVPLLVLGFTVGSKAGNGAVKLIGFAMFLCVFIAALLGAAGLALRIGAGLPSARDGAEPWRRVLRGGIVLGLTFVLPFAGTFVILPLALSAGLGALLGFRCGNGARTKPTAAAL
jgi:hypothetical protein